MALAHLLAALVAFTTVGQLALKPRSNLPMLCLVLAMGLLHGVIPLLTAEDLRTVQATEGSRVVAAWYALCGITAFIAGYTFHCRYRNFKSEGRFVDSLRNSSAESLIRFCFWACLVLSSLGLVLIVRSAGVGLADYANASRFEYRFERNAAMMWLGSYLFHLSFTPGFLGYFLSRRERLLGVLFAVFMTLVAFFFLYKGTRHVALGILGSALFGYALSTHLTARRLVILGVIGGTMAFSAVSLYEVRKELHHLSILDAIGMTFSLDSLQEPLARDPLNYHEHLIGAIEYFPEEHPYLNLATYRRMLTFYLPGSDFPLLKPELPGRVFASVVYGNLYDANMNAVHPPSLLGDAYINAWGWPGLLVLFANGVIVSWLTSKTLTNTLWLCAIGPHACWYVVLGPRGNPYDYYVMGLIMLVLTYLILMMAPRKVVTKTSGLRTPQSPKVISGPSAEMT